jgi:16S rRNA processing protein RimM
MQNRYLEAGRIVGTHGVKGELRLEPWCDSAEFLAPIKTLYWDKAGTQPVKIVSSRPHKSLLLITIEGVDSATQGDTMRGKVLYLDRRDAKLPKGRYFIQDIIGLSVCDADTGVCYGELTDVLRTGANDVYQVTASDKKDYLVPAISSVIISTDLEQGKMLIRPIRGIFEDAD